MWGEGSPAKYIAILSNTITSLYTPPSSPQYHLTKSPTIRHTYMGWLTGAHLVKIFILGVRLGVSVQTFSDSIAPQQHLVVNLRGLCNAILYPCLCIQNPFASDNLRTKKMKVIPRNENLTEQTKDDTCKYRMGCISYYAWTNYKQSS